MATLLIRIDEKYIELLYVLYWIFFTYEKLLSHLSKKLEFPFGFTTIASIFIILYNIYCGKYNTMIYVYILYIYDYIQCFFFLFTKSILLTPVSKKSSKIKVV